MAAAVAAAVAAAPAGSAAPAADQRLHRPTETPRVQRKTAATGWQHEQLDPQLDQQLESNTPASSLAHDESQSHWNEHVQSEERRDRQSKIFRNVTTKHGIKNTKRITKRSRSECRNN